MKVIIDIPDNEYKQNRYYYDNVYHAIPLDDVKAEIKEQKSKRALQDDDLHWYREGINDVLAIIDNVGKAESEDKE